jgi:hypothetical protein
MPRCLTEDSGEHINQQQMSTKKEVQKEAKKKGRKASDLHVSPQLLNHDKMFLGFHVVIELLF